jgi:hypothetical protein
MPNLPPRKRHNMKRTSKIIMVLAVLLVSTTLVSAALLTYFGQVQTTANVEQAVVISADGNTWNSYSTPVTHTIPEPAPGGETFCFEQWIWNRASIPVSVSFAKTGYDVGITTTYSKHVETPYSYAHTFLMGVSGPVNLGVTVADVGDWLLWTYTYAATPTHTPKMTVSINYPTGFAITTFDDGHDGWYYAPDGGSEVRIGDYAGASYGGWVETTAVGNVLTVKILKSELGDSFHWHGYANYDGVGVWINAGETGTGYGTPPFEVTLKSWQPLTSPFTMQSDEKLLFRICYAFDLHIEPGTYTLTTTIDANELP